MKTFLTFLEETTRRIILMGGPGSGKSTYAEYITKRFTIPHIYPGGMLRKEVEKGSEIGQKVKDIISTGQFVPNEIVLKLIKDKVDQSPSGYVLDGWPISLSQVRDMEEANIGYDKVIFLDVSREEILKRLLARGRADDTEEIINNRIDLYNRETGPAVEYFRGKPGFVEIKAEGGTIEDNANKIIKAIEDGN
jgi:adenylate kinase